MDTSLSGALTLNTSELSGNLNRIRTVGIGMLVVGAVLTVVGFIMPRNTSSLPSYLMAYLFWLGVTTGSLGWFMVHNVAGGGYLFIIRRMLEAATRLLPVMAVLFVPIVIGLHKLYPWTHPDSGVSREVSEVLHKQTWWMNEPFFYARVVILFGFWMLWAYKLNRLSAQQDESDDPLILHRMNMWSAPGLPLFVLSITVMAIDWVMVLTPAWVSSIIGFLFVVGQGLSVLALMQVLTANLGKGSPLLDEVPPRFFRDLGNMTLAFVLLWSYMSFSQYLITYSGNQQEESVWYVQRALGGWPIIGFGLLAFHFAFPFLALLSSTLKVRIQNMAKFGLYIIFMRFIDLLYWVQPTFRKDLAITPLDIGLFLAMGGLWITLWTWQMQNRNILPRHDARLDRHWPEVAHAAHTPPHDAAATVGSHLPLAPAGGEA